MQVGKYSINVLETGTFGLDGGAMFGIVPKPLWERTNPADESNRITLGARCLLLQSQCKNILIDVGIGSGWEEKFVKIYSIDQTERSLHNSLERSGLNKDDITDVILTHLHFDHVGGAVTNEDGKWIPAFPNAKYYVQKEHFDWANNPSERDRGSFVPNRFLPLRDEGVLEFWNEEHSFDDEIELTTVNGHTFSQQLVKIADSSQTYFYCADLIPTSSHVPVPYVMGYDLQPLVTVSEKKKILQLAVEEEWKIIFEHDPGTACAVITKNEKGFTLKEKYKDLTL